MQLPNCLNPAENDSNPEMNAFHDRKIHGFEGPPEHAMGTRLSA